MRDWQLWAVRGVTAACCAAALGIVCLRRTPALEIEYLTPTRWIELAPPQTARRVRCRVDAGWVEVDVARALPHLDRWIAARVANGSPSVFLPELRIELLLQRGTWSPPDVCPLADFVLADVLEEGHGLVFDAATMSYLGRLAVRDVWWSTHDPGCEYRGFGRIFTRASGQLVPGPDMQGCSRDCLFWAIDQAVHVTKIL